jgi:hypothetical protein
VARKAKWETWFRKCRFNLLCPEVEEVYERIYLSARKGENKMSLLSNLPAAIEEVFKNYEENKDLEVKTIRAWIEFLVQTRINPADDTSLPEIPERELLPLVKGMVYSPRFSKLEADKACDDLIKLLDRYKRESRGARSTNPLGS